MKLLFSCFVLLAASQAAEDGPIVQLKNGRVQGRRRATIEENKEFFSFQGIPFAEPPIGELRFEPPVQKSNWEGVWDATEDRSSCTQGTDPIVGTEDCLFINVYTPVQPSATCESRSVFLWIYGGGFEGGISHYDEFGPDHILETGVVVVTFNYRLGFLGFASTGDSVVPGNNGLKDQLLAVNWVRENINSFCGNPNDITLGGQSAGAASVVYHLQSPKSRGLFQKAIVSSGSSLSLWALSRRVPAVVTLIGQELGVDTSSSQALIKGLKQIGLERLQNVSSSIILSQYLANNPREGFVVGPVFEHNHPDAFITERSHEVLSRGDVAKIPTLIGYNSQEGTYTFETAFRLFLVQYDLDQKKLLPADLNVKSDQATAAARELKNYYFGWLPVSLSNTELMRFLSHDQFVRSIRETARLLSKQSHVYLYRFSYEGGLWGFYNRTVPGVTHSEELGYYWVSKHAPASDHDLVVRSRMITLFTNFIKNGNPTPTQQRALQNVIWDNINTNLEYLEIGHDLVRGTLPEQNYMKFWDDFYAKYGNPPYSTY